MNSWHKDVDGRDKPGHDACWWWFKVSSAFFLLLVGGCISRTPSDLAFVSARAVDLHDQAEIPGPGATPLRGLVNNRDLIAAGESLDGGEKPHRLLLKVEFSSALDIARYVSENDYSLGAYTSFCNRLNYEATISSPRVYSRGYLLGRFERDPFRDASTTKTYYLFVEIAQKASPKDIPPREAFDLRQKPEDLCLVLKGGNNSGFGYESNTVTIPSDAIATALRQIPASASAAQSEGASN